MRKVFFIILILVFFVPCITYPQLKIEAGGGYIYHLNQEKIFAHNNNGWQLQVTVVHDIIQKLEVAGTFIYQQRVFDPESFSFMIPFVVGYTVPRISTGDDLQSYGFNFGVRFTSKDNALLNIFLSTNFAMFYFNDASYYMSPDPGANYPVGTSFSVKYADSKFRFENSFGIGLVIKLLESLKIIIEPKFSYIYKENIVYFPFTYSLQIRI